MLGLVAAIWGIIGFKVLGALSSEPELPAFAEQVDFKPKKTTQRDTFSIAANYRDPFLGTMAPSQKKSVVKAKPPKVQFPNVAYTGLVSGQQTKDHIFFVTINGAQHLMQKRNTNDGVTLVSGNANSIKIRYKGISKTISLSNAAQ